MESAADVRRRLIDSPDDGREVNVFRRDVLCLRVREISEGRREYERYG